MVGFCLVGYLRVHPDNKRGYYGFVWDGEKWDCVPWLIWGIRSGASGRSWCGSFFKRRFGQGTNRSFFPGWFIIPERPEHIRHILHESRKSIFKDQSFAQSWNWTHLHWNRLLLWIRNENWLEKDLICMEFLFFSRSVYLQTIHHRCNGFFRIISPQLLLKVCIHRSLFSPQLKLIFVLRNEYYCWVL